VPRNLQLLISDMCSRLNVDGLRGDLVINRAAKALVAYEGRDSVTQEDVGRVISACLNHRCVRHFDWSWRRCVRLWWRCAGTLSPSRYPSAAVMAGLCIILLVLSHCLPISVLSCAAPLHPHRLRKDPLDPIDSGTKVQILFNRLTDPEFAKREEEAKKRQVGAAWLGHNKGCVWAAGAVCRSRLASQADPCCLLLPSLPFCLCVLSHHRSRQPRKQQRPTRRQAHGVDCRAGGNGWEFCNSIIRACLPDHSTAQHSTQHAAANPHSFARQNQPLFEDQLVVLRISHLSATFPTQAPKRSR
jgi:hypothetical protein